MRSAWIVVALVLGGCEGTMPDGHHHHGPVTAAKVSRCRPPRQQVVDLTHRVHEGMPVWPGGVPFAKTVIADYDGGYRAHKLELGENAGTHLDAPSHVVAGQRSLHEIPLEELVAPLVVIDVRAKTERSPDYAVPGSDIVDWEAIFGPVPVGSVVVFYTGWAEKFEDPAAYLNQDGEGVMHFPGLSAEAAELLVERDVVGVGIDTLSIDPGTSSDLAAHRIILGAGKYQLENLAGLGRLPEVGATIIVGVLPLLDGTQAPARVIALVPEKDPAEENEEK
jgi:kynurenine formamidase